MVSKHDVFILMSPCADELAMDMAYHLVYNFFSLLGTRGVVIEEKYLG
jgi:hypothetical protein